MEFDLEHEKLFIICEHLMSLPMPCTIHSLKLFTERVARVYGEKSLVEMHGERTIKVTVKRKETDEECYLRLTESKMKAETKKKMNKRSSFFKLLGRKR
jgi:hypothetical protein